MHTPLATWNPAGGVWETAEASLLCGHSVPFSATWPTSGMTRDGQAFAPLTPARLTDDSASSSLLPTPAVNDMGEGKTPDSWDEWTAKMQAAHGNGNGHGKSLAIEAQRLMPTPAARDYEDHRVEMSKHRPDDTDKLNRALATLLPTPQASDGEKGGPNQRGSSGDLMLPSAVTRIGDHTPMPSTDGSESSDE